MGRDHVCNILMAPIWGKFHPQTVTQAPKMTHEYTCALRDFFNETGPPLPTDNTHQRTSSFGTSSVGKAKAKKLGLLKSKKKAEADDSPRIRAPPPGTVAITLNSG